MFARKQRSLAAATRLHQALTAALPLAGTRQLGDGPTAAELEIEAAWARELEPIFIDLYRYPLRDGGLSESPDDEEPAFLFFLERLGEDAATRDLASNLVSFGRGAFDVGGQLALDEMGLDDPFELHDEDLLEALAELVALSLVATDGDLSLTRTTARDLARWIAQMRQEEMGDAEIAAALGGPVGSRSVTRAASTAETETVRFSRWGMAETYEQNTIAQVIHRILPGACRICAPREGNVYNVVGGVAVGDALPLHPNCRCWHEPAVDGQPVAEIDWTPPEGVWTGG